jgi:hypothetical protein
MSKRTNLCPRLSLKDNVMPGVVAHTHYPALGKLRQEDPCKFKASLNYIIELQIT